MQPQKTILLADGNQDFLLTLTRRVQELGVKVITVADGLDALMSITTDAPDLIILDIDLPSADGLKICEKLGQNVSTSGIPVFILTAKSDEQTLHRCEFLGAHYVHKDLNYWDDLKAMIFDCLDIEAAPAKRRKLKLEVSPQIPAEAPVPKVLVIDDDPQITQALAIRLGALGIDVIEAPNAAGGTYLAWTECPDLIITDQNMPGKSGENLIIQLKNDEETKDIPIIVITGQTVGGREDRGLKREMLGRRGAVAYLTKPVNFDELVEVLRHHIQFPSPPSGSPGPDTHPISQTSSKRG